MATDFTRRVNRLDIPEEWTEVGAKLIPKTSSSKELKSYCPVSSLAAVRKLWVYAWMELLEIERPLHAKTMQTAFVKAVDAAQGSAL